MVSILTATRCAKNLSLSNVCQSRTYMNKIFTFFFSDQGKQVSATVVDRCTGCKLLDIGEYTMSYGAQFSHRLSISRHEPCSLQSTCEPFRWSHSRDRVDVVVKEVSQFITSLSLLYTLTLCQSLSIFALLSTAFPLWVKCRS